MSTIGHEYREGGGGNILVILTTWHDKYLASPDIFIFLEQGGARHRMVIINPEQETFIS